MQHNGLTNTRRAKETYILPGTGPGLLGDIHAWGPVNKNANPLQAGACMQEVEEGAEPLRLSSFIKTHQPDESFLLQGRMCKGVEGNSSREKGASNEGPSNLRKELSHLQQIVNIIIPCLGK